MENAIKEDVLFSRERLAGVEIEKLSRCRLLLGGAGNTGSHFVERAIRNFIRHILIIDFDKEGYQPHNFAHSSTLLRPTEDVGKPKAETLAKRANEQMLTEGQYTGKTMDVRDIGPEIVRQFDIALGFFDNKEARAYLYEISREAGVPFMEVGLNEHGDWQLQFFDHASEAPCYCCSASGADKLAMSCAYTYFNDVKNGIAPVTDVSGAQAAAFAMLAIMQYCSKSGFADCNKRIVFHADSFEIQKIQFAKKPDCPICSSNTDLAWAIPLRGRVDCTSYKQMKALAENSVGKSLQICLPHRFVSDDYCPKCGKRKTMMSPEYRISMSDVICEECVDIKDDAYTSLHMQAERYDGLDALPEKIQDLSLYDIGFPFGGQILAYDEQMECQLFTMQDDVSILNEFGGDQS